jgi:hypothetical protein
MSLAQNAGDCLLRNQAAEDAGHLCGGFPYGLTYPQLEKIPTYFSFDTGICCAALVDLAMITGDERFAKGAQRAGNFLMNMQQPDGSFKAAIQGHHKRLHGPTMEDWFSDNCILHAKNAIAFLKLYEFTGQTEWLAAARRTLNWACDLQGMRGEFPLSKGSDRCMTHTHCYATEGLLYGGVVLANDQYLAAGIRAAEWLRVSQRRSGGLNWFYRTGCYGLTRALRPYLLHVGPVAQAARIWWLVSQLSFSERWGEAATRALGFLARVQRPADDSYVAGAFPQGAYALGPVLKAYSVYSPWEAIFTCEAIRLWKTGSRQLAWSIF